MLIFTSSSLILQVEDINNYLYLSYFTNNNNRQFMNNLIQETIIVNIYMIQNNIYISLGIDAKQIRCLKIEIFVVNIIQSGC